MNQAEERYTQWVRATFPYVDSFRAPSLKKFSDPSMLSMGLNRSGFSKHFEKWTNRYTLTKAWQFRSGARFVKTGDTSAEWQKKNDVKPLRNVRDEGLIRPESGNRPTPRPERLRIGH